MKIYLKGGFWRRFFAFVIDEIVIILLLSLLFLVLRAIGIKIGGLGKIIFWFLSVLYNTLMIFKYEATLGKKLFKLKVVTASYERVNFSKAFLRESVGKLLSTAVFNLGYLFALLDKERKTWHDKIAKTFVVKVDDRGQLIPVLEEKITTQDKLTFWGLLLFISIPLIPALFVIFYLFFVAQPQQIKGAAMTPNYTNGQYYLTDKWSYRFSEPKRGDVIVYKAPNNPKANYFRRIVGLPGEEIEIREAKVYINGQILNEPYLAPGTPTYGHTFLKERQKFMIPQGQYFVMGDNRSHSFDSRAYGPVSKESIIGKITICYWNCSPSK